MSYEFSKSNIDHFLYELAKEYKKMNRAYPEAEIILIGGASMLVNYSFRDMTTDIDAYIKASSSMKDAINKIGDAYGFTSGWLNDDFKKTESYTPKIVEYSKFYKKFCNCLTVRTLTDEYLLAMKLCSARMYKKDLSDIIGILKENQEKLTPLDMGKIDKAVMNLYGGWEKIKPETIDFLKKALKNPDLQELYYETIKDEQLNKNVLLFAEEKYNNIINNENTEEFIKHFKKNNKLDINER